MHRECPVLRLGLVMMRRSPRSRVWTISQFKAKVILGVDTHLDTHVGAVISDTGKLLGTLAVPTDPAGYLKLLTWANSLGR